MDNRYNFLSEEVYNDIEKKEAKPKKSIKKHTDEVLADLDKLKELGYIEERIYKIVEKAIIYHDLGKLNEEFQKRIKNTKLKFNENKEVAHNILSPYFIDKSIFEGNLDVYVLVLHAVMNHHNYCENPFDEIRNKAELIDSLLGGYEKYKMKKKERQKLLDIFSGLDEESEDNKIYCDAIKVKGYLHKCDYSASSGKEPEYKNDFLSKALESLLDEWKMSDENAKWNELQEFCKDNNNENIIAVAQTGMGKTEAGLLWIGDNKGFFVLPLRTAINAIYKRIKEGLINNENYKKRVAILHSSSLEYYLNKDKVPNESEKEEAEILEYEKVSKKLAMPLNITTMDQIFDFVFKYQGFELKLTTLSYSKIVIDEIQMYSPDILAYLIYGIEKVTELGGKVAMLTATLAPFVKDLLKSKIKFVESDKPFINNEIRHNVKILYKRIDTEDILNKYNQNLKYGKSNKILVVCNTIKEAQRIYGELKVSICNESGVLNMLHSKFIRCHRAEKEDAILKFGQTFIKDKVKGEKQIHCANGIWVSTSLVEASLDIDFDYIYTELQEINSLLQRFGRCNRKGVKDVSDNNCFVYTDIDEKSLITGDKGFIDRTLYEISKEALKSVKGPLTEKDKIVLIDSNFTTDKVRCSNYINEYKKAYDFIKAIPPYEYDGETIKLRNIASVDVIPSPIYEENLADIQEIERQLKDKDLSKTERIKLQDKLMQFVVSVHPSEISGYKRAKVDGKAVNFSRVRVSDFKSLDVIQCYYDYDFGFRTIDFKEYSEHATIW